VGAGGASQHQGGEDLHGCGGCRRRGKEMMQLKLARHESRGEPLYRWLRRPPLDLLEPCFLPAGS
jgi:hypothetical protein